MSFCVFMEVLNYVSQDCMYYIMTALKVQLPTLAARHRGRCAPCSKLKKSLMICCVLYYFQLNIGFEPFQTTEFSLLLLFFCFRFKAHPNLFCVFDMQFLKRSSALSCEDDEAKIETVAVSSQVRLPWSHSPWGLNGCWASTSPSQPGALRWELINVHVQFMHRNKPVKQKLSAMLQPVFRLCLARFSGSVVACAPSGTILHLRNPCTAHYSVCVHDLCLCKHSHLPHSAFWVPPLTNWLVKEACSQTWGQVTSHTNICRHGQASVFAK